MLRIRDLREDKDLYGKDVAKILDISQQHYSRIENHENEMDYKKLMQLAIFYNTSIDYILGLTNDPRPYNRNDEKDIFNF